MKLAKKIIHSIIDKTKSLKNNPFIGQLEPLLNERTELYRYLVVSNYKLIYSVDENKALIKIADVFDTRQNPDKMLDR